MHRSSSGTHWQKVRDQQPNIFPQHCQTHSHTEGAPSLHRGSQGKTSAQAGECRPRLQERLVPAALSHIWVSQISQGAWVCAGHKGDLNILMYFPTVIVHIQHSKGLFPIYFPLRKRRTRLSMVGRPPPHQMGRGRGLPSSFQTTASLMWGDNSPGYWDQQVFFYPVSNSSHGSLGEQTYLALPSTNHFYSRSKRTAHHVSLSLPMEQGWRIQLLLTELGTEQQRCCVTASVRNVQQAKIMCHCHRSEDGIIQLKDKGHMVFTNLWLCITNSIIWILGRKEIASFLSNFFPEHRNQMCISRPIKIANKG